MLEAQCVADLVQQQLLARGARQGTAQQVIGREPYIAALRVEVGCIAYAGDVTAERTATCKTNIADGACGVGHLDERDVGNSRPCRQRGTRGGLLGKIEE